MRRTSVLFAVVLCSLPPPAEAGKDNVHAIVGARILPVSGPALDNATIVLRAGLIEAVGVSLTPPPDARIIDGKGLTLTPGLIDGFGGVGLPSAAPRAAGAPSPGAAASPAANPLQPQALALDRVRAADALKVRDAGVTTVLVVPKEGVLPGRSVLLNLSGERIEGMVVRQPAALHLHLATLPRQYPGSLMGTVAYARQALYDAQRYRDAWANYERAPRGKQRPKFDAALQAWQGVSAGQELLVVTGSRENDVHRTLALADEFKVKVVLAGAPQAYRLADVIKAHKLPLLVGVNFDAPKAASFFGAADEERERREIEEAEKNPAELHKKGVGFALVSAYARDFVAGVRKAIEKGLPQDTALRAVTLTPAEILGVADRLGSLEPGKIANVVAWTGEPLAKDVRAKLVFVDGELYEPEEPEKRGPAEAPRAALEVER